MQAVLTEEEWQRIHHIVEEKVAATLVHGRPPSDHFKIWVESLVESTVLEYLEQARHTCPLSTFNDKQVEAMIHRIKPNEEAKAGKEFLLALLDAKGIPGLERFMEKANQAFVEHGKLSRDVFDSFEWELYKKCKPDLQRRKVLFGVAGALGVTLAGRGGSKFVEQMLERDEEQAHPKPKLESEAQWKHYAHTLVDGMKMLEPYVELSAASVTLGYAAKERWDARFEQVAEGIQKFSEQTRQHQYNSR